MPCHRVLPGTGALGNYGGGPERKRALVGGRRLGGATGFEERRAQELVGRGRRRRAGRGRQRFRRARGRLEPVQHPRPIPPDLGRQRLQRDRRQLEAAGARSAFGHRGDLLPEGPRRLLGCGDVALHGRPEGALVPGARGEEPCPIRLPRSRQRGLRRIPGVPVSRLGGQGELQPRHDVDGVGIRALLQIHSGQDRAGRIDHRRRHRIPPLLQVRVLKPLEAVEVVIRAGRIAPRDPRARRRPCALVGGRDVVPPADLQEDVGRHVERVLGVGSDRGVRARRLEAARSELRIVVGVDQVVGRAGVVGVGAEDLLGERDRLFP